MLRNEVNINIESDAEVTQYILKRAIEILSTDAGVNKAILQRESIRDPRKNDAAGTGRDGFNNNAVSLDNPEVMKAFASANHTGVVLEPFKLDGRGVNAGLESDGDLEKNKDVLSRLSLKDRIIIDAVFFEAVSGVVQPYAAETPTLNDDEEIERRTERVRHITTKIKFDVINILLDKMETDITSDKPVATLSHYLKKMSAECALQRIKQYQREIIADLENQQKTLSELPRFSIFQKRQGAYDKNAYNETLSAVEASAGKSKIGFWRKISIVENGVERKYDYVSSKQVEILDILKKARNNAERNPDDKVNILNAAMADIEHKKRGLTEKNSGSKVTFQR